jgi:hypothetical protein
MGSATAPEHPETAADVSSAEPSGAVLASAELTPLATSARVQREATVPHALKDEDVAAICDSSAKLASRHGRSRCVNRRPPLPDPAPWTYQSTGAAGFAAMPRVNQLHGFGPRA